jgi:hypothetical protein
MPPGNGRRQQRPGEVGKPEALTRSVVPTGSVAGLLDFACMDAFGFSRCAPGLAGSDLNMEGAWLDQ